MDINYKPRSVNWFWSKKTLIQNKINNVVRIIGIICSILFFVSWGIESVTLLISSSVIGLASLIRLIMVESEDIDSNIYKPNLKVEFLQTGKMKYYIVCGKSKKELRVDDEPVDFLTEDEVQKVKQELNRRWLFCEQEALQRAYEEGYKSKSKLL